MHMFFIVKVSLVQTGGVILTPEYSYYLLDLLSFIVVIDIIRELHNLHFNLPL